MKSTLLDAYNMLRIASEDYNHPNFTDRHGTGPKLQAAAMLLRRFLNGEVIVNNESMTLEEFCDFMAAVVVQFQENWEHNAKATPENWPQAMSLVEWEEQFQLFSED